MTRRRTAEQTARTRALVEILLALRDVCGKIEALLGLPKVPTAGVGPMILFKVTPVLLRQRPALPLPTEAADRDARVRALLKEALRLLG